MKNDEIDEIINDDEINDELLDDDVKIEVEDDTDFEIMFKNNVNKHKLEGTHSLKRDTIILGKEDVEDEDFGASTDFYENSYDIEKGSVFEYETLNNDDYLYKKGLEKDIYDILNERTDIDFLANRRKPNRDKFNEYFEMCVNEFITKYTKSEIFVVLTTYFTDNVFNMFKLLNKKNAIGIISELKSGGYLDDIGNINFI